MKLIIAEKPSLARNIASALGIRERKDGYLENNKYIISWAFGHILELNSIYDYLNNQELKWKDIPLPFIPEKFLYKLKNDDGVKKQFKILKELINRDDVLEIVNCGDADREGQLIIDNIINAIGTNKPIKRLWLPEQTDETIRKEINNLKDNKNYKNLYNEGLARTKLDWLLGINLTVYLTVKSGQKLACGRVLIPIVKYIYDRDISIKNFTPKTYYQAEGILDKNGVKLTLSDERKEDVKETAENIANTLSGKVKVIKIEKKEVVKQPKKLFSLSTLQSYISNQHKMSFASSLQLIQNLYEKGYITYPRTNTEYLAENEKNKAKELIKVLDKRDELDFHDHDSKRIFDSSKIESHSAITPTKKIPQNLEDKEKLIYEVVKNRFIANFLKEKTITEKTTITLQAENGTQFKLTGEVVVQEGFYKYEPKDFKNELPHFTANEEFEVIFEAKEKKTSPPKKISEEELSNYLKNPFKKELKDSDDEDYKAILDGIEIGTEATRTGIIENAKKYGYISQKKSTYSIELLGEKLIEILDKLNINLYSERTVEFSKLLKKIYKEEKSIDDVLDLAEKELNNIINQDVEIEKISKNENLENLGTCPMCKKGQIHQKKSKEGKIYYSCSEKECKFFVWEETKHFNNPIKLTKTKLKGLLAGKKQVFKLKTRDGRDYEVYLKFKINENFVNFESDGFPEKKKTTV